jgi:hypothetical protein
MLVISIKPFSALNIGTKIKRAFGACVHALKEILIGGTFGGTKPEFG